MTNDADLMKLFFVALAVGGVLMLALAITLDRRQAKRASRPWGRQ